jgi:hypothetical protein
MVRFTAPVLLNFQVVNSAPSLAGTGLLLLLLLSLPAAAAASDNAASGGCLPFPLLLAPLPLL